MRPDASASQLSLLAAAGRHKYRLFFYGVIVFLDLIDEFEYDIRICVIIISRRLDLREATSDVRRRQLVAFSGGVGIGFPFEGLEDSAVASL